MYVQCPLKVCEQRDVKGLYKKARSGQLANFTGISDPYEVPENPDISIDTNELNVDESLEKLLLFLGPLICQPLDAIESGVVEFE